jgi:hypothetical protein
MYFGLFFLMFCNNILKGLKEIQVLNLKKSINIFIFELKESQVLNLKISINIFIFELKESQVLNLKNYNIYCFNLINIY